MLTGEQLELTRHDALAIVEALDVVEGVIDGQEGLPMPVETGDAGDFEVRNLFGEADRIAARASSAGTRRQYAAIYRRFAHWLREELGRPPVVGDLDADYARHLATAGGEEDNPSHRRPRAYSAMVRALARPRGAIADVRAPRHDPGPPETLTGADYANLLRVPDRRSWAASATTRCCGSSATADFARLSCAVCDLRRPRSNARHFRLFVRDKGGREHEVLVPKATQQALESWVPVHPLARVIALPNEDALFVRLGRHTQEWPVRSGGPGRLIRRSCLPGRQSPRSRRGHPGPPRAACVMGDTLP